jgi:hypothetical protein
MSAQRDSRFGDFLDRQPERLVVTGFRCCMAGYDFLDVACWEAAWQSYIRELGPQQARLLMGELQYWVRTLRLQAQREVTYFPQGCRNLCHDECMALSAVSAAQSRDAAAGCLAIRHLLSITDAAMLEDVWSATLSFATALANTGQPLYPVTIPVVESIARMQSLLTRETRVVN